MPIARIAGFHVEERWSRAAWWCRRLAVFALVLGIVGIFAHRLRLIETLPLLWVLALVAMLCLLALLAGMAGFQRVWYFGDRGGWDLALGILLAAALLVPFSFAAWLAFSRPALSDISTDLDDPPQLKAAAAFRTAQMNALGLPTAAQRDLQTKVYPEITGRRYTVGPEQIVGAVQTLIDRNGWEVVSPFPADTDLEVTVEAVARSAILAIPYDVAVRITDEGNATYVDMRSASRYLPRDLGVNAELITDFLSALDQQAATLAGVAPPSEQEEMPDTVPIPPVQPPQPGE